jgi:hypothetical protein
VVQRTPLPLESSLLAWPQEVCCVSIRLSVQCLCCALLIALNLLAAFLIVFASACLSPPPPTSTPGGGGALSGFRWLCLCCGCMITVEPTVAFGAEAPESRPCLLLAGPVIRGKSHNLFEV